MSIAADSSHYDYINYEKTNLAAKVHGFLQTTKNNLCFVLQDAKFVVLLLGNHIFFHYEQVSIKSVRIIHATETFGRIR